MTTTPRCLLVGEEGCATATILTCFGAKIVKEL
jgi:hypothetical protein